MPSSSNALAARDALHSAADTRSPVTRDLAYWTDFAIHIVGVACGLVGAAVLLDSVDSQKDSALATAQTIYALSLVAMLTCSALYNTIAPPRPHSWLRRADHAAIFLMIAGTVTPFALHGAAEWRIGALGVLWLCALGGAMLKLFMPHRYERQMLWLYALLTWAGFASLSGEVWNLPGSAAWLLCAGVLLYTLGFFFHLTPKLRFATAIWHGFVLVAAACHYFAIMTGIVLPSTV